jgi:hypothetical protein
MPLTADGNPGHQAHAQINKEYNGFTSCKPANDYSDEDCKLGKLDPNDEGENIERRHGQDLLNGRC